MSLGRLEKLKWGIGDLRNYQRFLC